MRFRFSPKVTIIGSLLIIGMLRLSYWQYERHLAKLDYIKLLSSRLNEPVTPFNSLLERVNQEGVYTADNWEPFFRRRVAVSGQFDFSHEVVLRNRRYEGIPGVYALAPLKLEGSEYYILVSRGFIPLPYSPLEERKKFQRDAQITFTGLLKETVPPKFLAPSDPVAGDVKPWVDAWLRVDLANMQKQLPYKILPVFLEVMESGDVKGVEEKIVSSKSGRDEMFMLPGQESAIKSDQDIPAIAYPVPIYDTVVPPGRHQGYIYEWAGMAVMTFLVCLVLQLKRPKSQVTQTP